MDIKRYSEHRTAFIRMYYCEARQAFVAVQTAIDNEEAPFDKPPAGFDPEYGEPAYLTQWLEAEMAINVLGYSCVSMLSNSLKIAFKNMEELFRFQPGSETKRLMSKEGFVAGYKVSLSEVLDTDWSDCDADFAIIEQVVQTRNITQHTDDASGFEAYYTEASLRKHPRPIFVAPGRADTEENGGETWFGARIEVTAHDLFRAIDEVDKLIAYIMGREDRAYEWWQRRRAEG